MNALQGVFSEQVHGLADDLDHLRIYVEAAIDFPEEEIDFVSDGKIRDSFSFRHFYITQQIREGVGHHLLGRNVGTSSKMIDAYYSKIRPIDEIAQLIPDWSKKRLLQYRRK